MRHCGFEDGSCKKERELLERVESVLADSPGGMGPPSYNYRKQYTIYLEYSSFL